VIITLKRRDKKLDYAPNYLTSSLAAILRLANRTTDLLVKTTICDVNRYPVDEIESIKRMLRREVEMFSKRDEHDIEFSSNKYENERFDYLFCLSAAINSSKIERNNHRVENNFNNHLFLVLQDDAIVEDEAFKFISNRILSPCRHIDHSNSNFILDNFEYSFCDNISGYKLHYPNKWQGFALDFRTVCELCSVLLIVASFTGSLYIFCFPRLDCYVRFGLLSGLMAVVACYLLGRQGSILAMKSFLNLRSFVYLSDCCIPAVLYPAESAKHVVKVMRNVKCSKALPFDLALAKFVGNFAFVEPNLFKHVGRVSTLTDSKDNLDYFNL
jgi:hypothetical protein